MNKYFVKLLLVFAAYFLTARLGLAMPYVGSQITLIWLPTGVAVAALMRWGKGMLPAIALAAFSVNMFIAPVAPVAFCIAIGNTLAPLAACFMLNKAKFNIKLQKRRDIFSFILVAFASMLISSVGGSLSLISFGVIPASAFFDAWLTWWLGDSVGVLLAAPVLLAFSQQSLREFAYKKLEIFSWVILLSVLSFWQFILFDLKDGSFLPFTFLLIPFIVWASLRFELFIASCGILLMALISTYGTSVGLGAFMLGVQHLGLLTLWAFLTTTIVINLLISALLSEGRLAGNELEQANAELDAALEGAKSINDAKELEKARYKSLMDFASDGIFIMDAEGGLVEFSDIASKMLGYSHEEMQKLHVTDWDTMIPKEELPSVLQAALEARSPFTFETKHRRKDGTIYDAEITARGVGLGDKTYIYASVRDITERKMLEERIHISNQILYKTLNSIEADIVAIDLATYEVIFANKHAIKIFGDITGKKCFEGMQSNEASCIFCPLERYGKQEIPLDTVFAWEYKNEINGIWYSYKDCATNWVDGRKVLIQIGFDITEQKKAEEAARESSNRLRTIINMEPECIKIIDRDGRLTYMNPAGLRMVEADSLSQVAGHPILDVIAPEFKDKFSEFHRRIINGEAAQLRFEVVGLKGGRRWLETHAVPMRDHGEIVHMAVTRDIDEQKKAEDVLMAFNEQLEQKVHQGIEELRQKDRMMAQQSKMATMGEMIGAIAHQWKQPLNALAIIVQNNKEAFSYGELTKEYIDESVAESMKLIWHMSKTIDDFRNFFRPDKEKTSFILLQSVEQVLAILKAPLRENGITVNIEQSEPNIEVYGYPNEFMQVVLNIVNNAKDALLEKAVKDPIITITICKEGSRPTLYIKDNAGGIPDSAIEHIFEPFFTTKSNEKGTGIGLSMSKTIIEDSMQGSLTAANVEGGAEFKIELPVSNPAAL